MEIKGRAGSNIANENHKHLDELMTRNLCDRSAKAIMLLYRHQTSINIFTSHHMLERTAEKAMIE